MIQDWWINSRIRIGIDGRRLGCQPKGIGRYIWELCRGLDQVLPKARFFLYSPTNLELPLISERWSLREDSSRLAQMSSNLWLLTRLGPLARRDNVDCIWSGTGLLPLVGVNIPRVLTIHDFVHIVAPETMDRRALWSARMFFSAGVDRADAIVTNSEGTASRLRKQFRRTAAAVVRPGVSNEFRTRSEREIGFALSERCVTKPYLLAVATWEPRKHLEMLIRTFLKMRADGLITSHTLVLVGERGWKDNAVYDLVRQHPKSVNYVGYIEDQALAAFYSGACAFLFPSSYEGFGIPVLEARACGATVVTSDTPELREAGGDVAVYVRPTEEGLREGILVALARGSRANFDRRQWTWSASARKLAEVLLSLLDSHSSNCTAVRRTFEQAANI